MASSSSHLSSGHFNFKHTELSKCTCTVKKIRNHIADRLLSKNKEKWLTIYEAYKKIDDLREKYGNTDSIENIKILDELNSYIENIEKSLQ